MHGCKARNVGERQTSVDGGRQDAAAPKRTFVRRRHEVVQSSSGTLRRAVSYMFSSSSARWRLVFTAVSFLGNVRPPFWEIRSLPPPLPPPCSLARQSSLLVRQRSLARSPPFSMCALAAPLCLPLCLALCRCRVRCLPACLSSRGTPAVRARRVLFFLFSPNTTGCGRQGLSFVHDVNANAALPSATVDVRATSRRNKISRDRGASADSRDKTENSCPWPFTFHLPTTSFCEHTRVRTHSLIAG